MTPDVPFPGTEAGDEVSYAEWEEGGLKWQGMKKANGVKHGIVRKIYSNFVEDATWNNNKMNGLSLLWLNDGKIYARLYKNGSNEGIIIWQKDWTERGLKNKEKFNEIISINDIRP